MGDILIGSGIETLVLQAGVVVGSGSASFEMIRHLTDRLPVMTTPKWVHNKIQPIARVSPDNGSGSRYDQRAVFFPRGIPGRLYWYVTRPVHALALRAMARKVTEAAG